MTLPEQMREQRDVAGATDLVVAWHYASKCWLMADGKTTTEDVDLAGWFTKAQFAELEKQYPGPRYPGVTSHEVQEIFGPNDERKTMGELQIRESEFVVWGYGPRRPGSEYVAQARSSLTPHYTMHFKLPEEPMGDLVPQEYERRRSWAWQFVFQVGEGWHLAESQEAALEAAKASALREMRETGHHYCFAWLVAKHRAVVSRKLD